MSYDLMRSAECFNSQVSFFKIWSCQKCPKMQAYIKDLTPLRKNALSEDFGRLHEYHIPQTPLLDQQRTPTLTEPS